ncbi:thrombospondin-related anonymous protein [Hepatocystis sp. ex Piliocolobus tephrosceles]|nr:thrombospondin-related anonymous protein [Hepatocystis sp. ex Piliocolobus tephrosceles]
MKLISNRIFLFFVLFSYLSILIQSDVKNKDTITITEQICNEHIDVHVLLDGSASIGLHNWEKYIYPLTLQLPNILNISPNNVNFSLILFNADAKYIIPYGSHTSTDKTEVVDHINRLFKSYRPRGTTNLTKALQLVKNEYNTKHLQQQNQRLLIVVTDGIPNNRKTALVNIYQLNKLGVKVIVFGVGTGVNNKYNRIMAGCKADDEACSTYYHTSWSNASKRIIPFLQKVCVDVEKQINCGEWDSEWSQCSVPCGAKGIKTKTRITNHENCDDTLTEECYEGECPSPIPEPNEKDCGEWDAEWSACSVACGGTGFKTKKRIPKNPKCEDTLTEECYEGECPSSIPKPKVEDQSNINNENKNIVEQTVNPHNIYSPEHDMINRPPENVQPNENILPSTENNANVDENIDIDSEYNEQDENNENNEKPGVNNAYKIAGAALAGIVLLGCGGVAYSFAHKGAAASNVLNQSTFENILQDDDVDIPDNEEFKLPKDDDWQG